MTQEIILFIITTVITAVLGVIGYFLKRTMDRNDKNEAEFRDAVNYLTESGYIRLRKAGSKESSTLADTEMQELEAKVTAEGIQIIACVRTDVCIDV